MTAAPPSVTDAARRMLDAAAEAFGSKGFHATSTRDIAARAGLSPAALYVYFPSKEDLLYTLSRTGHEEALALVTDAIASRPSPSAQLAEAIAQFTVWHVNHYALARVVYHEFPHLTPEHREQLRSLRRSLDRAVHQVLRAGMAGGDFEVEGVEDTTLALLSLVVDVARWYSPSVRRGTAEIAQTNATLALRMVGHRPGGRPAARRRVAVPEATPAADRASPRARG